MYIYEGQGTTGPLLVKFNSFTGNVTEGQIIYESPTNTSGMLTIRFRTDSLTNSSRTNLECFRQNGGVGRGFELAVSCGKPCESVEPVINDKFYRTRHGVIYDSAYIRMVTQLDTIWNDADDHSQGFSGVDTTRFLGAHLCVGDGVIFNAHGVYSFNYGYYTPSDATSFFTWDMDHEGDSITGVGVNSIEYNDYQKTGCYNVSLRIVDAFGCGEDMFASVKVRTSVNPIKTIFTLSDICNNSSLPVNMGYSGENATLTLREVETDEMVSKVNEVRTFIPDGCGCGTAQNPHSYYEAPVDFTEFPAGKRVTSASDICSICINMEHSYLGDFFLSLVCPTGQEAVLKFGNRSLGNCEYPADYQTQNPSEPGGAYGGGTFLGFPIDGFNGINDQEPKCDSLQNPFGIGLDYCFSRDEHYTLVTGDNAGTVWSAANPHPAGDFYIASTGYTVNLPVNMTGTPSHIPAYFTNHGGDNPGTGSMNTKMPSNHLDKEDYYLPYATFDELIGCPLNGTWKVRIYDTWGVDNGWVFNWSLDICNVTQDDDCKYTVGIDSLIWRPDPSPQYHDYDLGHYRGVVVEAVTPTLSRISSPDTAGTFPIDVFVYDEFGCVWDTVTSITTFWTPEPKLGPDTSLCGVDRATLDATDRHTATENYSYTWSPFGQNTPTIMTQEEATGDIDYVASVLNTCGPTQKKCVGRDTIRVSVRKQPLPNFTPEPFSFEGCDPMTITFHNQSIDADRHLWVFGDGVTSELSSPTHTYAEGIYTLKYYAISDDGCIDSVVSEGGIAVYPKPNASFVWDPVYPSVLNPVVNFTNTTTPHTSNTQYYWQIQYDRDNPLSFETLTTRHATFDFSQYNEDVSGNYNMRLIARTSNLAPSGNVIVCPDTAANNILVINDFLQFPNVVTPNGDGVNDRFVIQNLVDGLGYPINSLDIYNQWGARVYHRENIASDEDFWDPADVPDGTYFYRFSARGYNGNIEHNGAIEVIH
ncbi:MAG: gliding motility-associated C-terminal domain-containing protein [Bacteroidales bacterium]|nr:gliding motility-associated C-terminal domain-containing protein [Bacteroidales bacterium]